MTASDRTLPIDGLVNARDLGGVGLRSGGTTPTGVLARSEDADLITDAGWERLRELGYRTVRDLRQPAARARDTHPRPDGIHVAHVDLDGLDDHPDFWVPYWDTGLVGTPLYYLPHLAELPDRAGAALRAIAHAPAGGVLFHCGAGRDRTGLVALLLLLAVGAEPDEIVDDYLESVRLGQERSAPQWKRTPRSRRSSPSAAPRARPRSGRPWRGSTWTASSTRRASRSPSARCCARGAARSRREPGSGRLTGRIPYRTSGTSMSSGASDAVVSAASSSPCVAARRCVQP
jgi:protein-tyrosine phosphatase